MSNQCQCEIQEQPYLATLSVKRNTPIEKLPQVLGEAYGAISRYLEELGEQPAGPPFAAYYNMDMQNLEVEIGFPVARELPGRDDIITGGIPGGKVATCLYVGPYNEIEPAYKALADWVREEGHTMTGVAIEIYLNDPETTPAQELQTRVQFPLATT